MLSVIPALDLSLSNVSIRDTSRLGKYQPTSSRSRPLLVKFNGAGDVIAILANRTVDFVYTAHALTAKTNFRKYVSEICAGSILGACMVLPCKCATNSLIAQFELVFLHADHKLCTFSMLYQSLYNKTVPVCILSLKITFSYYISCSYKHHA